MEKSKNNIKGTKRWQDQLCKAAIFFSAGFTMLVLVLIIGFILVKGLPGISFGFLTHPYEDNTTYVTATGNVKDLGIELDLVEDEGFVITKIESDSILKSAVDGTGKVYVVKKGDLVKSIGKLKTDKLFETYTGDNKEELMKQVTSAISSLSGDQVRVKITRMGGGIVPMFVTTLYMIFLSLIIAAPIGILAAIYLNEYAKQGRLIHIIHFAIENLAGIPSIIYGLFGSLFFVKICKMQYSVLAGAMTVAIILLPTIITTTEETLKAIPKTYRESSLGLGATKLYTIRKIVLPNAIPGILVAVLLSMGRIVGESAALLLTAGSVAQIPQALVGNSASGATLTIKMYTLMKEENNLTTACAIGIVTLFIIIMLNIGTKLLTKRFLRKA